MTTPKEIKDTLENMYVNIRRATRLLEEDVQELMDLVIIFYQAIGQEKVSDANVAMFNMKESTKRMTEAVGKLSEMNAVRNAVSATNDICGDATDAEGENDE